MKKLYLGQFLLAGLLVFLLAAGCTMNKEKTAEEENQESTSQENTNENESENEATEEETEDTTSDEAEEKTETKVEWKLVSGDPLDTCSSPTYTGEAEINGWYVYETNYVDKEWLFQISDEDVDKLPVEELYGDQGYTEWLKKPLLQLTGASEELENELKSASVENPVTITIKGYRVYCEGNPQIGLEEF